MVEPQAAGLEVQAHLLATAVLAVAAFVMATAAWAALAHSLEAAAAVVVDLADREHLE